MAWVIPDLAVPGALGGHAAELETLELLRRKLPAAYTIFHSVHWTRGHGMTPMFGEADFVVVNAAGSVLVVEQKMGALEEGKDGLGKRYDGTVKSVPTQIHRNLDGLRDKFKRQTGHNLEPDYLLFCPQHRVTNLVAAGLDEERIVDARDASALPDRIMALLPEGSPSPFAERVTRFFEQHLSLIPDIHAHLSAHQRHYARAVGGLADTIGNVVGRPLRLSVRGTAGCGKSLVAVQAFRDAVGRGKRPLLLCFNRDLKEKLKVACGAGGIVETWHGALDQALLAIGQPIDHDGGADWHAAAETAFNANLPDAWQFDTLIVDEGQDFEPEWRDMLELELFGHAGTDRIWLDDPDQAIQYGLEPCAKIWPRDGWTGYRARCNYRSPRSIAQYIKALLPFDFEAANPLLGSDVGVTRVTDRDEIPAAVGRIAAALIKRGFAMEDIIVLSLRGLTSATLGQTAKCGTLTLKRPLGSYDLFGNQQWSEGRLRFNTIRRYKGQQDAAVILTDVEMPSAADRLPEWQRLMFAALTRATDRVEIVVHGPTADLVAGA